MEEVDIWLAERVGDVSFIYSLALLFDHAMILTLIYIGAVLFPSKPRSECNTNWERKFSTVNKMKKYLKIKFFIIKNI